MKNSPIHHHFGSKPPRGFIHEANTSAMTPPFTPGAAQDTCSMAVEISGFESRGAGEFHLNV